MKTPIKLSVILLVIAITAINACGDEQSATNETNQPTNLSSELFLTKEQIQLGDIKYELPSSNNSSVSIQCRGQIVVPPQSAQTIHLPFGGFVLLENLLPGKFVKKGELLFRIKNPEFIQLQQNYLESRIQLEQLRKANEREMALSKENINAQKELELSSAQFEKMRVSVAADAERLQLIGIDPNNLSAQSIKSEIPYYAPTAGYIREILIQNGNFLGSQQGVLIIDQFDQLMLSLNVFEKDLSSLNVGQEIDFSLINEPKNSNIRKASLSLISSSVNTDGNIKVFAQIKQRQEDLRPGMYVDASIQTELNNQYILPESAIVSYNGKQYAFYHVVINKQDKFILCELKVVGETNSGVSVKLSNDSINFYQSQWVDKGARSLLGMLKNL